jgi:hypothetical protein
MLAVLLFVIPSDLDAALPFGVLPAGGTEWPWAANGRRDEKNGHPPPADHV